MAETAVPAMMGYGYASDEVKVSTLKFGLNTKTFLKKFEFNPNGGKEDTAQECLDIVFNINGTDKSYRMFPVSKVYGKKGGEITDTSSPEYIEAFNDAITDFNARVSHIMHCFIPREEMQQKMKPVTSFKDYVNMVANLLPKDFATKELDIFLQYQYSVTGDNKVAYLEIPKKMVQGRWISIHQPGQWVEIRKSNPEDNDQDALVYGDASTANKDERGAVVEFNKFHPIKKNGWFVKSNYANQQRAESGVGSIAGAAMNGMVIVNAPEAAPLAGLPAGTGTPTPPPATSGW